MKKKLLLFGDSFVDYRFVAEPHFLTYYHRLKDHFDVQNFGRCGTGPKFSLQQFINQDKNLNNKKNTNILFVASQWGRFNFKFYIHTDHHIYGILSEEEKKKYKWTKPYKKYDDFIKSFYKNYVLHNSTDNILLQNMLLVKHYARNYNKCIYWPIFEMLDDEVRELYNSEKFYIPDYRLGKLMETGNTYPNHMTLESHNKVYQLIIDVFNETS